MERERVGSTLYVARFPPSASGVALYAVAFRALLARLGPVSILGAPRDSQSLRQSLRGLWSGLRRGASKVDCIHIELSGRALFEFYFCLGALMRRRRPTIAVTCHDPPSIVGLPMLFRVLDRRGLRRLGSGLSGFPGRWLEHRLMSKVDVRFALTEAGATTLSERYAVPVVAIPHLIDTPARVTKEQVVFVPGPISDARGVRALLPAVSGSPWRLLVGATTTSVQEELRADAQSGAPIALTGFQSEESLLATFSRAAIVVRPRPVPESGGNPLAASGPLAWAVSRGCVCITNDRRAGANELADTGLIIQTDDLEGALRDAIGRYDPDESTRIAETAQTLLGGEAVASRYLAARSRESLRSIAARPAGPPARHDP